MEKQPSVKQSPLRPTSSHFVPDILTREQLSIDRDALLEEQNRSAKRLDQLTVALREQREEKARLADQVRRLENTVYSRHDIQPIE